MHLIDYADDMLAESSLHDFDPVSNPPVIVTAKHLNRALAWFSRDEYNTVRTCLGGYSVIAMLSAFAAAVAMRTLLAFVACTRV